MSIAPEAINKIATDVVDALITRKEGRDEKLDLIRAYLSSAIPNAVLSSFTIRDKEDEIRDALFPLPVPREDGMGETDSSADENLEAAIIDLEIRGADPICIKTLNEVLSRLVDVRRIIEGEE